MAEPIRISWEGLLIRKAEIEEIANSPYIITLYIQKNPKIITLLNKLTKIKINIQNKETEINAFILEIYEEFDNSNENITKVIAVHPFYLLKFSNKFKVFPNPKFKTIYDVFDEILKDYKLKVKQKCSGCFEEKREFFIQYDESDINFINRKANSIGANIKTCFDGTVHISSLSTLTTNKFKYKDLLANEQSNYHNNETILSDIISYNPETVNVVQSSTGTGSKIQNFRNDILDVGVAKNIAESYKSQFGYNGMKFSTHLFISPLDEITTDQGKLIVHKVKHIFSSIEELEYTKGYYCKVEAFSSNPKINFIVPKTTPQRAWITTPNKEEAFVRKDGKIFIELIFNKDIKIPVDYLLPHHHNDSYLYITPRDTEEVIVEFLNNNPDFPIVIGSVANGKHKYEHTAFQTGFSYSTQKAKDRKTSILIDSTESKKESVKSNIPFDFSCDIGKNCTVNLHTEDDKGDFLYTQGTGNFTHTQKKGNYNLSIDEGNYDLLYKKGNQSTTLKKGNKSLLLEEGNITIENKKGNYTLTLKDGHIEITSSNNISIESKSGDINMKANNIKMEASKDFNLSATNGNFKLSAAGKMEAAKIDIKASAALSIKGAQVQVEGSAMLQMKAAIAAMDFSGAATIKAATIAINAPMAVFSGMLTATMGTFSGPLTAAVGTFMGPITFGGGLKPMPLP